MDRRLEDHLLRAVVARWNRGECQIESDDVYNDLIAQGINVPPGAMRRLFKQLLDSGQVQGALYFDDNAEQHGGARIISVSLQLIPQYS